MEEMGLKLFVNHANFKDMAADKRDQLFEAAR
jgi:hypothetical protein